MEHIVSVRSSYFCAGVIHNGNLIVEAAPILRWAVGRKYGWFIAYANAKGWIITSVHVTQSTIDSWVQPSEL